MHYRIFSLIYSYINIHYMNKISGELFSDIRCVSSARLIHSYFCAPGSSLYTSLQKTIIELKNASKRYATWNDDDSWMCGFGR